MAALFAAAAGFSGLANAAWVESNTSSDRLPDSGEPSGPYGLSISLAPAPMRFRFNTTQTRTRNIDADRSGEDIGLSQPEGENLLTLKLETGGPWHFSAEQHQATAADHAMLSRKQNLFNLFPITLSAAANAKIEVNSLKLSAGRTLLENEAGKFGLLYGINITSADWSLTSTNPAVLSRVKDKGTLPLPTLGVFAEYKPSRRTRLKFQTEYFALSHGQADGRSFGLSGLVEYKPIPRLTLGAGIVRNRLNLTFRMSDYMRDISLIQGGPYLNLQYSF